MAFCDRLTAATCNRAVSLHRGKDLYVNEKVEAVLNHLFVHQIHHRGQFSVYLRMADAKVPAIYGPSLDEPWF